MCSASCSSCCNSHVDACDSGFAALALGDFDLTNFTDNAMAQVFFVIFMFFVVIVLVSSPGSCVTLSRVALYTQV
jgi:hypothetical protein